MKWIALESGNFVNAAMIETIEIEEHYEPTIGNCYRVIAVTASRDSYFVIASGFATIEHASAHILERLSLK